MNPVLKVQTTSREQVSFQCLPGGGIDVILVHPGSRINSTGDIVPDREKGQPLDQKIATLRREDAKQIVKFFSQFA